MSNLLIKLRDKLDTMGPGVKVYDPAEEGAVIFDPREEERDYAKLPEVEVPETNRYGDPVDLIARSSDILEAPLPQDRPMHINDVPEAGCNPNRNKQHGFHFTADNCIGCHACEAACSEKNDNPAHIAFRNVGYVEGGSYPAYQRLNISMACNHCDNPVCLKGCPTRAYTKHAEYGAVLQDPDTCFGCGYCTWVCPYNAPQLDPIEGQVSKCNMCVDRLEVGLKPACVSACLGNALNFGVIENTPENREQAKVQIPGFPDPEITHPNIRFEQIKTLPDEMNRTDSMPIKYRQEEDGSYRTVVDEKNGKETFWNFKRLSSRENPLVIFTLATQAVIGAFTLLFLGSLLGLSDFGSLTGTAGYVGFTLLLLGAQAVVLFLSTLHLGKPLRFYRGFNNLKHSPLSREALGIALFAAGLGGHMFFSLLAVATDMTLFSALAVIFGFVAIAAGMVGLYFMHCIYRIKARPFWNHWQVLTSFYGTGLTLGAPLLGLYALVAGADSSLLTVLGGLTVVGLAIEGFGLWCHARYLNTESGEGSAAHYIQCTTFGKSYLGRNVLMIVSGLVAAAFAIGLLESGLIWLALSIVMAATALVGRALFYVLVIPTTMPGAFFWKNKGFEQHARDIGLAEMPQVGVVPDAH
ncbi:MAG: dimethyl sulfoxide reductase anchor subunit [Motiliproteus sp.]|nr:dimethyl sulfoxide reductase anchor subunit [Motiliproteus sp.]